MNLLIPEIAAAFILTFARVGTLVMLLPGIGEQFVFSRARLSLAVLLTIVFFPMAQPLLPLGGGGAAQVALLISEILIGLVLGLAARMVAAALQTAGTVTAQQLGLAFAMTVDPTIGGQQAAIGNLLTLLGITLIFVTDLHHLALGAIRDSYTLLPPGGFPQTGDALTLLLTAIARGFTLAVQLSAPFIAFGILFNLGVGVLSRLMPQLQVFFLALPASILLGMLVLLSVVGVMMGVFIENLGDFLGELGRR